MLKSVFLVLYLFSLSCFAEGAYPSKFVGCEKLDVTNCGPFYCILTNVPTTEDSNALKCVEDKCFTKSQKTGECNVADDDTPCKHSVFVRTNDTTDIDVCVSVINHFSDCRLTNGPLTDLHKNSDSNFPVMEEFCEKLGCGGVYMYFDDKDIYFHCEEPNEDGTEGPDDFDESNCKKFEYAYNSTSKKCEWDPCASYDTPANGDLTNATGDSCSSGGCQVLDLSPSEKLCIRQNETKCGPGSWNLAGLTSDGCAEMGCGGLDVAKSVRGNSYLFCKPAPAPTPKKNGASYLHVATIILAITIFAFL